MDIDVPEWFNVYEEVSSSPEKLSNERKVSKEIEQSGYTWPLKPKQDFVCITRSVCA